MSQKVKPGGADSDANVRAAHRHRDLKGSRTTLPSGQAAGAERKRLAKRLVQAPPPPQWPLSDRLISGHRAARPHPSRAEQRPNCGRADARLSSLNYNAAVERCQRSPPAAARQPASE
eukprot:363930-Chlamydomonas_euryale.AAC.8